jgi:hypothetical protein
MSPLSLTFETRTFIDSGAEGPTIEGPAAVATCGHRPRLNTAHSATSSPNTLSNSSPFNPAGQPEPSRPSAYAIRALCLGHGHTFTERGGHFSSVRTLQVFGHVQKR